MTITKKDIDVIKIKMTWDYVTKDVDIHSRNLLQYFAVLLTFILGVVFAALTKNCDFWVALPLIAILLFLSYLCIRRIRSLSRKLRGVLSELIDELDKLK